MKMRNNQTKNCGYNKTYTFIIKIKILIEIAHSYSSAGSDGGGGGGKLGDSDPDSLKVTVFSVIDFLL